MVQKCFCTPDGSMDPTFKIKYISSRFVFNLTEILIIKQILLFFWDTLYNYASTQVYKYASMDICKLKVNLRHISGKSHSGISQADNRQIPDLSQANIRHIFNIYKIYLGTSLDKSPNISGIFANLLTILSSTILALVLPLLSWSVFVKTPTSTQHITMVGFDMKMTV